MSIGIRFRWTSSWWGVSLEVLDLTFGLFENLAKGLDLVPLSGVE